MKTAAPKAPKAMKAPQPDPWQDFCNVYLDMGYALHGEIKRDPATEQTADALEALLTHIRSKPPHEHRELVHRVIELFRGKSREVIWQEPTFFDTELPMFPGVELDVAQLWRERPLYRNALWQFIEQLYVIGNVCLHPNRKDKFLQAVRQLKEMRNPPQPVAPPAAATAEEEGPVEEEDLDGVIDGMAQMFGMGDNPAMKRLMGKMARSMHETMSQSDNPMGMLQAIMNRDMSVLGDLEAEMHAEIEQSVQTGELSEADFERTREGMAANFGGMEGLMQMAQGMGLQVPVDGAPVDPAQVYQNMALPPATAPAAKSAAPTQAKSSAAKKQKSSSAGSKKRTKKKSK